MRYVIFENGEQINTIVADEEFCKTYCEENGYTYELELDPEPGPEPAPEPEPEPTPEEPTDVWDELDKAYQEGVDSV